MSEIELADPPRPCKEYHPLSPETCHLCKWAVHPGKAGEEIRKLWVATQQIPPAGRHEPCIHLGAPTGAVETDGCASCPGKGKRFKVFACDIYGTTTPPKCMVCPDYATAAPKPPPDPVVTNRYYEEIEGDHADWPADWRMLPEVRQAFIRAFKEKAEADYQPGDYSGRGIVTCAGGNKFFACAWVQISMLRWLKCELPVEVWHLGQAEMSPQAAKLLESLGNVRVVDAHKVRDGLEQKPRTLNGWELKPFSVLHSAFEEVLFIDADCFPVRNPSFLFGIGQYQEKGAIFWPDLPPYDRKEWIPNVVWSNIGMPPQGVRAFESGQFLINKAKCLRELSLTMWLNEHSDYFYKMVFGDKDTYCLAWNYVAWARNNGAIPVGHVRTPGIPYAMPAKPAGWKWPAILQYDMNGQLLFEHCCRGKEMLAEARLMNGIALADKAQDAGRVLMASWRGKDWDWRDQTPEEHVLARAVPGLYRYEREGIGVRHLELLPEGAIGHGAASCEKRWTLRIMDGEPTLVITGESHKGSEIAMMFLRQEKYAWRGKWEAHERGPVNLAPLLSKDDPPLGWICRHGTWDRDIFDTVVRDNKYGLPAAFSPEDVIIDIGAHIGAFSLACLERGAGLVIAVEPEPENFRVLCGNLARHIASGRLVAVNAAVGDGEGQAGLVCPSEKLNTGGWTTRPDDDGPVQVLSLGFLVEEDVRLIKFDCEGDELRILRDDCYFWDAVDEVVGEYHNCQGAAVRDALLAKQTGFDVTLGNDNDGHGIFIAKR